MGIIKTAFKIVGTIGLGAIGIVGTLVESAAEKNGYETTGRLPEACFNQIQKMWDPNYVENNTENLSEDERIIQNLLKDLANASRVYNNNLTSYDNAKRIASGSLNPEMRQEAITRMEESRESYLQLKDNLVYAYENLLQELDRQLSRINMNDKQEEKEEQYRYLFELKMNNNDNYNALLADIPDQMDILGL